MHEPQLLHIRSAVATGSQMECHSDLSRNRETVIEVLTDQMEDFTARRPPMLPSLVTASHGNSVIMSVHRRMVIDVPSRQRPAAIAENWTVV